MVSHSLTLILPPFFSFFLKMLAACYVCYMYSNTLAITFTMGSNTMIPDQTAPGAV